MPVAVLCLAAAVGAAVPARAATPAVLSAAAPAVSVPVPGAPTFPATIDAFPRYESENGCSATAKPGAVELQRILRVTYGAAIGSNIVRGCTSKASGHEEGRAIDWMVSQRKADQRAKGDAFVGWLLAADGYGNGRAMARRLGVQYVIWKSRILMLTGPTTTWREYSTCLTKRTARSDDTYCHRNHVHVSLTWAGARKQTTWYTQAGLPACTQATAGTLPAAPSRAPSTVGVAATTVLDTGQGIGTPRLAVPCRLPSEGSLRVRTTGSGLPVTGVPAAGVAEVQLKVTAWAAGLPTEVYPRDPVVSGTVATTGTAPARSTGAGRAGLNLVPGGTGTVTWWVRADGAGTAALQLGPAVQRVKVDVVGYRLRAAASSPDDGNGTGTATVSVDVSRRRLP